MKCTKCGAENVQGSQFCLGCGNTLQNNQMPQQQNYNQPMQGQMQYNQQMSYQQPKKSHVGVIIICSIIAVIMILAIIIVPIMFKLVHDAKNGELLDQNSNITEETTDNGLSTSTNTNKKQKISDYSIGDPVTLVDGSEWHVIGTNGDKLVLILDKLVVDVTGYGKSATPEAQLYANSLVKEYIDNTYAPALKKSLKSNGGDENITARLLSAEEFIKGTGKKYNSSCEFDVTYKVWTSYLYEERKFTERFTYEGADKLSVQDKFVATLALTGNFWTMSNITERTADECSRADFYKGAYYIETRRNDYGGSTMSEASLVMDWEAVFRDYGHSTVHKDTSAGIRPVIETSLKNVK